jgi:hypothetical protein
MMWFKRKPKPSPQPASVRAAYVLRDTDSPHFRRGLADGNNGKPCERRVLYISTMTYGEMPDEEWRLYQAGHAQAATDKRAAYAQAVQMLRNAGVDPIPACTLKAAGLLP